MAYPSSGDVDAAFSRLLAGSYGPVRSARRPVARAVSLSADTGAEVLPAVPAVTEEYIIERGEPPVGADAATAAGAGAAAGAGSAGAALAGPAERPASPASSQVGPPGQEARPPSAAPPTTLPAETPPPVASAAPSETAPSAASAPPPAPAPAPAHGTPAAPSAENPTSPDPYAAATLPIASPAPADASHDDGAHMGFSGSGPAPAGGPAGLAESDLAADMQAILMGQKVFDPQSGGMRDRQASAPPPPPPVEAKNEQAIFDRIAESMAYAQAYDLGTVELQRRFDSFDRVRQAHAAPKPLASAASSTPPAAGQREFIRDLSAIDDARRAADRVSIPFWSHVHPVADAARFAFGGTVQALGGDGLSRPFFDTGEHVRAGDDISVLPLTISGVAFSYGDLITMGDFFESPETLRAADAGQLETLRTLIRRSAGHYRDGRGTNPSDEDWSNATGGRYLRLAANNYDHFSPASVAQESFTQHHGDNRSRYAQLHQQALRESQQLHLAHPNATPSLESALIVNAFADHFLTDAFAAGHLVNKELVIDRFRSSCYRGSELNAEGNAFFGRVAQRAFRGDVARKFSALEQYEPSPGNDVIGWHANINSVDRFAKLLRAAAEAEPVKIANVAVKAVHDHLNASGVAVGNAAGAAPWTLHGDGHLDTATLTVMRQAVAQSVANLSDPSLLAGGVDLRSFVDRAWAHVPVPTPAGVQAIRTAIGTYTSPTSTVLSDAAADLITGQVDQLIAELLAGHHLRRA